MAWGVVAFYLLVAVELTSLARRRLPTRLWRLVHVASFPLWAIATLHLLTAGTDAQNPLVQWAALGAAGAVFFVTIVRVLSPRPRHRGANPPAGARDRAAAALGTARHDIPANREKARGATPRRPTERRSDAAWRFPNCSGCPHIRSSCTCPSSSSPWQSVLATTAVVQSGHTGAKATWERTSQEQ